MGGYTIAGAGSELAVVMPLVMRSSIGVAAIGLLAVWAPLGARAVSLNDACSTFAAKLSAAKASGDSQSAQTIYQKGSQRIASKFNGATCPDVNPPSP